MGVSMSSLDSQKDLYIIIRNLLKYIQHIYGIHMQWETHIYTYTGLLPKVAYTRYEVP
jgi:hypothetical protein